MPVLIKNRKAKYRMLPYPVNDTLLPNHQKRYPYVEYDKLINNQTFIDLQAAGEIQIISLEGGAVPLYDSVWNGPARFRLGAFQLWVDGTGALRMKNGDATGDLEGVVIGPGGGMVNHGFTHVLTGADPIPNLESLENLWGYTVVPGLRAPMYESAPGVASPANASSLATMPVVGLVRSVPSISQVELVRSGELAGFAGALIADSPYFVGTAPGTISLTAPVGTGRVVQRVGYAITTSILMVDIGEYTVRA